MRAKVLVGSSDRRVFPTYQSACYFFYNDFQRLFIVQFTRGSEKTFYKSNFNYLQNSIAFSLGDFVE